MTKLLKHVRGENRGKIVLYTLSTCQWCRKTKDLLNSMGVEYYYVDVDLLEEGELDAITAEVDRWNPNQSFPTIVFNDAHAVLGFNEKEIRAALGT